MTVTAATAALTPASPAKAATTDTAQLIQLVIDGRATLEDMKVLANNCPEALRALKVTARKHGLPHVRHLTTTLRRALGGGDPIPLQPLPGL